MARANAPNVNTQIHFNNAFKWASRRISMKDCFGAMCYVENILVTNLRMIATHEFGHALGLGHSEVIGSSMNGTANTGQLHSDDIAAIVSLYGEWWCMWLWRSFRNALGLSKILMFFEIFFLHWPFLQRCLVTLLVSTLRGERKPTKEAEAGFSATRTTLLLPQKLELPLLPPVTTLPPLPPLTTLPPLPPLTTLPPLPPLTTLPPLPPLTTLPPLPPLTTLPPLSPVTTMPPLPPVTTLPPLSPVTTLPPLSPVTTLLPFFRDWLNINQKNYNYFENAKAKTAEWNSENFEVPNQLKTDHSSESQFKVLKNCINLLKLF